MVRRLVAFALPILLVAVVVLAGQRDARSAPGAGADLAGAVRVVDGDTLEVSGARVRLFGVDAPEDAQACREADGAPWPCGDWATDAARARWEGREAACEVLETDRYGRAVARCEVAGEDLGAALVRGGMALAYLDYSRDYLPEQEAARAARAGLWRGSFEAPWDWRAARREGAPEGCAIKGNVSDSGRVYHEPGGRSYEGTRIDEGRGERWFCTVEEAEAAGWRPARG